MKIPVGIKKIASMCILQHGDQFLLLKRGKEPNKGMYVPVGGKLEPFENQFDACLRETKEETGIQLNPKYVDFCGTLIETSPTIYNWMCYIYIAEIDYCPPPYCDEGVLEWIAEKDLLKVTTPPPAFAIYQYVLKNQPFAFSADYNEQMEMTRLVEEIEGKVLV